MLRKLPLLTTIALLVLVVALTACDGDDETTPGEEGTATSATTTEANPTQAATAAPTGANFSGSATATVVVGDQTFAFKDGRCDKASDEAWLAINIGQPTGSDYFGLLVGAHPGAGPDVKHAEGGGEFTEGILVTANQGGSTFTMAPAEGNTITLEADLGSGEFGGTTIEGEPISGSFECG
jgi:hypothetical protein